MNLPESGAECSGDFEYQMDTVVFYGDYYFFTGTHYPITSMSVEPNAPMLFQYKVEEVHVYLGEIIDKWHVLSKEDVERLVEENKGIIEQRLLQAVQDGSLEDGII